MYKSIKMTLVLTQLNDSQKDLLIKLAQELHIKIEVLDDEDREQRALLKLSEQSFAEEWDSEEDKHWDDFLKSTKDVSKR
jgi:hypothetical protein